MACNLPFNDYGATKNITDPGNPWWSGGLGCALENLVLGLRNVAIAIGIIMIIVAGIKYVTSTGDPEKAKEARDTLIWAIGGIIFALTFWIVIRIVLIQAFGLPVDESGTIELFFDF